MAIRLVFNAKKSLSSCQLARDLDLNQKTAWYMQQRIRTEIASKQNGILLQGIVEANVLSIPRSSVHLIQFAMFVVSGNLGRAPVSWHCPPARFPSARS